MLWAGLLVPRTAQHIPAPWHWAASTQTLARAALGSALDARRAAIQALLLLRGMPVAKGQLFRPRCSGFWLLGVPKEAKQSSDVSCAHQTAALEGPVLMRLRPYVEALLARPLFSGEAP